MGEREREWERGRKRKREIYTHHPVDDEFTCLTLESRIIALSKLFPLTSLQKFLSILASCSALFLSMTGSEHECWLTPAIATTALTASTPSSDSSLPRFIDRLLQLFLQMQFAWFPSFPLSSCRSFSFQFLSPDSVADSCYLLSFFLSFLFFHF